MSNSWNPHIGNIFQVYARADRWDVETGLVAYQRYHEILEDIASKYSTSAQIAIGAFAALSPNNDYAGNLKDTHRVLAARVRHESIDSFNVTTYGPNKAKAWRICQGENPLDVLAGRKTNNFYRNIQNPLDPNPVTIDGHMYSVWQLKRFRMDDAKVGSGTTYDDIADDFRTVARVLGILPNQLQATCWHTWKRINLIVMDRAMLQIPMSGELKLI